MTADELREAFSDKLVEAVRSAVPPPGSVEDEDAYSSVIVYSLLLMAACFVGRDRDNEEAFVAIARVVFRLAVLGDGKVTLQ